MSCWPRKCCCFSLETGVLVIAVFSLVTSSIGFVDAVVGESNRKEGQTSHGWEIGNAVISLFAALCLLYGVLKKKQPFLILYIVLEGIGLVMCIILELLLVMAIMFLAGPFADRFKKESGLTPEEIQEPVAIAAGSAFILAFVVALNIYFWFVIISYYKKLGQGDEEVQSDRLQESDTETGKYVAITPTLGQETNQKLLSFVNFCS